MEISYGVSNLRSIEDMDPVALRPITVLVGANSSGKSTFLRSFSLLRQSLREKTDEPILWFDENSVDFGDFSTAIRDKDSTNRMKFKFKIENMDYLVHDPQNVKNFPKKSIVSHLNEVNFNVEIIKEKNKIKISEIEIKIVDFNASLKFKFLEKNNKFYLNYKNIDEKIFSEFYFDQKKIFDTFSTYRDNISKIITSKIDGASMKFGFPLIFIQNIYNLMLEYDDKISNNVNTRDEALKIAYAFPLDKGNITNLLENNKNVQIKEFYKYLMNNDNCKICNEIKLNSKINMLLYVYAIVNFELESFFKNSTRVGPARELSKRYYRRQSLDVSEISEDGRNFPMLLLKLNETDELKKFSRWLFDVIGYNVEINGDLPNVEINMVKNGLSVNLVDTGYGISQILPILAQIWLNTIGKDTKFARRIRTNERSGIINAPILMEQPELHLHPMHQAQLADALVNSIKLSKDKNENKLPLFIVETHSEVLINRLGALIRDGEIPAEHVQIAIFSKRGDKPNATNVSISTYKKNGTLKDWPYGFFNY